MRIVYIDPFERKLSYERVEDDEDDGHTDQVIKRLVRCKDWGRVLELDEENVLVVGLPAYFSEQGRAFTIRGRGIYYGPGIVFGMEKGKKVLCEPKMSIEQLQSQVVFDFLNRMARVPGMRERWPIRNWLSPYFDVWGGEGKLPSFIKSRRAF